MSVTNIEKNGSFRLSVIRRVLDNFDHFGGLFNHSTLSGICQIVSIFLIHNLIANRFSSRDTC